MRFYTLNMNIEYNILTILLLKLVIPFKKIH